MGVAGAGAFTRAVPWVFDGRAWGHAQDLNLDDDASQIFSMVPRWLQTVQRAEYWGVILALQAAAPIDFGIDNLPVCNNVGKILDGWSGAPLSPLYRWRPACLYLTYGSVSNLVMLLMPGETCSGSKRIGIPGFYL